MKIGFTGTQSTGKTTLVKSLSLLPEFSTYHIATERSKYLRDLGIPLNTDSTLKGQNIFLSERISELMRPDVLSDRTIIDVMAFTMLAKSISYSEKEMFMDYASYFLKEYDYLFYVSPKGVEIEDNKIRTTDSTYRNEIDDIIKTYLSKYDFKIKKKYTIEGDNETRISTVMDIIFR